MKVLLKGPILRAGVRAGVPVGGILTIQALHHVRRMRGGAQAQLMCCSDRHLYVVKFQNNPQHLRVLANSLLATRLAEYIGLPVPRTEVIEVGEWLIQHTPDLRIQLADRSIACLPGLQFGSRYVIDPPGGQVLDYLPDALLPRVRNLGDFAGALALDKWTCNVDVRQAVFSRKAGEWRYTATFIDQGHCFNAGEWSFPDSPLQGVHARNEVYTGVTGWESFEPWLSRIEGLDESVMWACAGAIPPEWYASQREALDRLLETLLKRRTKVRDRITEFRESSRRPFPRWVEDPGRKRFWVLAPSA